MRESNMAAHIYVWVPALRRGAPSNAFGMRGMWSVYGSRREALAHIHYACHQACGAAKRVLITDSLGSIMTDADLVCQRVLLDTGDQSPAAREAARLIAAGDRVAGIRALLRGQGAGEGVES